MRSLDRSLRSSRNAEFKRVYGKPGGTPWKQGDKIVLADLGATLSRIAEHGAVGFYKGKTADLLVAEMKRGGGYVAQADLTRYRARVRVPIRFTYRDYVVFSSPPPSSGGITLAQQLQILESFDIKSRGRWSVATNHLMIEAMRRAYAQRAQHLGDSDFVDIPESLTTKKFAKKLASTIDEGQATRSATLGPRITQSNESPETTHFSVIDKSGMAVSNTYTLEAGYGSGVVVTGAGFLLNNEMGDFNARHEPPWYDRDETEPDSARETHVEFDDADDRDEGRQAVPGHWQSGRADDHQHRLLCHGQRVGLRDDHP